MSRTAAEVFELRPDALRTAYRSGGLTPSAVAAEVVLRADKSDPAIWIDPPDADRLQARAVQLAQVNDGAARLPLYGVPIAVKDNIAVAGRPTTAGCPAFSRLATRSATVVRLLESAGAMIVGKTNMDQFATGLVGTRSPYGTPLNPVANGYVPGGSSSGSACAVAAGLASVALGTDTAGSGRVPAAMQGLIGLKPTRGIISTTGVVPACRSLDCVSVFARSVADAAQVFDVLAVHDPHDAWCRPATDRLLVPGPQVVGLRVGVPDLSSIDMDQSAAVAFHRHVDELAAAGLEIVPISFGLFAEAGALLYHGPWIAERLLTAAPLMDRDPGAIEPIVRTVLEGGRNPSGVAVFRALHRLAELRADVAAVMAGLDLIVVPSVPRAYRLSEVAADPVGCNDVLGTFTNFVNLLDLCAVAVPSGVRPDGVPVGFTLIAPPRHERLVLAVAAAHADLMTPASSVAPSAWSPGVLPLASQRVAIAVVGAHLAGQPLHHELQAGGATLLARTHTAAAYRLYALAGTTPAKPGLVRSGDARTGDGQAIEVEVYSLPVEAFAGLVCDVAPPLAISALELADGAWVAGFVCAQGVLQGATDITEFGGWRAYTSR